MTATTSPALPAIRLLRDRDRLPSPPPLLPTLGHKVYGAIGDRWHQLGAEKSYLGRPLTDEIDFDGGRMNRFEHGSIYWWSDTGAIDLRGVVLRYVGIQCFSETDSDQSSGSDEPYVVLGTALPDGATATVRSRVYADVDGRESVADSVDVFHGAPSGLVMTVQIMENDFGDADAIAKSLLPAVQKAGTAAGTVASYIPGVGPIFGEGIKESVAAYTQEIADFVVKLLGLADDPIGGNAMIVLSAKDLVVMAARQPKSTFRGITSTFESPIALGSGDAKGASYKAAFTVDPL